MLVSMITVRFISYCRISSFPQKNHICASVITVKVFFTEVQWILSTILYSNPIKVARKNAKNKIQNETL